MGAVYGPPQDGAFHHDYLVLGYYERALDLGVRVYEYSEVKGVGVENGRVVSVSSNNVFVKTKNVVFAAGGAWTGEVMKSTLNIDIPIKPSEGKLGLQNL